MARAASPASPSLKRRLRNVYWIGGGSGAGKSTIARRLAATHGLRLYSTDDVMADHAGRCSPKNAPCLADFLKMSMDERWVHRSPEAMTESFHWFRGEGFHLIVEDLLNLPAGDRVIVEGFRLLPRLVSPLLYRKRQGVWLIPTPEFRRAAFASRGSLLSIAEKTSDPARALRNLLDRDRLFTDSLRATVKDLRAPMIEVDRSLTQSVLESRLAARFKLEV